MSSEQLLLEQISLKQISFEEMPLGKISFDLLSSSISLNFSGIILGFCVVAKYFVDFRFRFRYFRKMTEKFWFRLNRFKILRFQTWRWWKLKKSISQLPKVTQIKSISVEVTILKIMPLEQMALEPMAWRHVEVYLIEDKGSYKNKSNLVSTWTKKNAAKLYRNKLDRSALANISSLV